ncbi:hypothetical protein [Streptomyces sp. NPDC056144]|uniref:hypothetical protein n=1 Tax=unclassified Streptomyces TaxID=2593676 RepID=UPI0035D74806
MTDQADTSSALDRLGSRLSEVVRRQEEFDYRLSSVDSSLAGLQEQVAHTRRTLDTLVEQYGRDREIAKAQAELTRLNAEWHTVFDQRRHTRTLARGLVHTLTARAVRDQVVNSSTVQACAEERMLLEPTYWLAPALTAVAAGYRSETSRAERARAYAQTLDEAKAFLFFALTSARLGEEREAAAWMDQYLSSLDPDRLGQDFLIVLDAIASNDLGEEALGYARQTMSLWSTGGQGAHLDTLHQHRWDRLWNLADRMPENRFPGLRVSCSELWPSLQQGWEAASIPRKALAHLRDTYPGEAVAPESPTGHDAHRVLHALERLIDQLEPDEAEHSDAMRWQKHIVECGGDLDAAQKAFLPTGGLDDEPLNISALLDRGVFDPENAAMGPAARRMAVQAVWPSLEACVRQYVATAEKLLPASVTLTFEDWTCTVPTDPHARVEQEALVEALAEHITERGQVLSEAVVRRWPRVVLAVLVGALTGGLIVPFVDGSWRYVYGTLTVLMVGWVIWELCRVPIQRWRLEDDTALRRSLAVKLLEKSLNERPVIFAEWLAGMAGLDAFALWNAHDGGHE